MNNKLLASLASVSLGVSVFAPGVAVAAQSDVIDQEIAAVIGPQQDYQQGLRVNGVAPVLRSVVVDGETVLAYCIEYWVRAAGPDHRAAITGWDQFTGDNHFKTDVQVREQVAWILRNSYPTLSLAQVTERVGTVDLTEAEAIAATQAAIWHFTDDFVSDGDLSVESARGDATPISDASGANVQEIFDYLTGERNLGLSEHEVQASVSLKDAANTLVSVPEAITALVKDEQDHVLGPIMLNASTPEVDLQLELINTDVTRAHISLLDASGEAIDETQPVSAEQLWVHVPAQTPTGQLRIAAEVTEYGYTGKLVIPESDPDRSFQTIVVVDQTSDLASTELELSWEQPPTEQLPVDEQPTMETSEEEPFAPETPVAAKASPASQGEQEPATTVTPETAEQPGLPEQHKQAETQAVPEGPLEQPPQQDASTEELAQTGAQQTRNILVALGTLTVGVILLIINHIRRRYTR